MHRFLGGVLMRHIYKGQKGKVSLLLAVMMAASLCLSVFFVSHNIEHSHEDADCQVCAILQIARANFQNLNLGASLTVQVQNFSLIPFPFILLLSFIVFATPVTEKIKLNN